MKNDMFWNHTYAVTSPFFKYDRFWISEKLHSILKVSRFRNRLGKHRSNLFLGCVSKKKRGEKGKLISTKMKRSSRLEGFQNENFEI